MAPIAPKTEDTTYAFASYESLVRYFIQWLPEDYVVGVIEKEKFVFVVRKMVSLEETRLQFLKKCENTLLRIINEIQRGRMPDWNSGTSYTAERH